MDPMVRAAFRFAGEVAAFLRRPNARSLRLMAPAEDRRELYKTLRLLERAPDNRRPFFLVEAPFKDPAKFFGAVACAVAGDYDQIVRKASADGVRLPRLGAARRGDAMHRAAWTVARVAELLGACGLDGVLVGLLPEAVTSAEAFARATGDWMRLPFPLGVRFAVLDGAGQGARDIYDAEARFEVPRADVSRFFGAAREPDHEREKLLGAARSAEQGDAQGAVEGCRAALDASRDPRLSENEGAMRMALASAQLAAGAREAARREFVEAAVQAERRGRPGQAAHAWGLVAMLAEQDGLREVAERASATQRALQERADGRG
jgi:hypothetical protein